MSTKKCKHCQSEIDSKAKICPVCKKKQGGKLKYILIGAAAILILAALINGGDDEPKLIEAPKDNNNVQQNNETSNTDNKNSDSTDQVLKPTTAATPIPDKNTFSTGETAELKDVRVTLVAVTESSGSQYNKPAEGNVFALAEFEIENNSDKDITVSSIMSFEAYSDGYSTSQSIAALLERGDKNQLDGKIASGKKMKGVIGYELPKDWAELEIHFTPDFWSDKAIVFIASK